MKHDSIAIGIAAAIQCYAPYGRNYKRVRSAYYTAVILIISTKGASEIYKVTQAPARVSNVLVVSNKSFGIR